MEAAEIARALKERARTEGAQAAGLAPALALPDSDFLGTWLGEGRHGTMGYMERPERKDVAAWYPGVKSVLVCAYSYGREEEPASPPPRRQEALGRVARYAAWPDYHPLLKARMESLLDFLRELEPGADGKAFVDTSPVLERAYARRAGIGWVGKNTMILHPRLGSFFFLAGLALNLELPCDEPVPDHCGSCSRCLEACPTAAFPRPHELDASRCVAYFTIEHRGGIPEAFREGIGAWVFGCDVCQDVCPWNRFPVRIALPEFLAGPSFASRGSLAQWLRMTPEDFKALKGTPLERARWKGWMRNVLLAAGNSGDSSLAREVEPWTRHEDPVLREQALWSLNRLQSSEPQCQALKMSCVPSPLVGEGQDGGMLDVSPPPQSSPTMGGGGLK